MAIKYQFEKVVFCKGTSGAQEEYLPIVTMTFSNGDLSIAVPALIDTGSPHTFIDLREAVAIKLMPTGLLRITTNTMTENKPTCDVTLQTECMRGKTLGMTVAMTTIVHPLYRAILGRDFLEEFEFRYDGLHGVLELKYLC